MPSIKLKNMLFLIAIIFSGSTNAQIPGSISGDETMGLTEEITFTENPCPTPQKALSETPNDLKIIQEDITRFTLCLQRAQLLSRLNDLASDNIESIDSSLEQKLESIASNFAPMPALEMPALPPIENNNQIMTDETFSQPEPAPEPVMEHKNWTINTIKGSNGVLIANISDADGNVLNVRTGDKIEDTKINVVKVTQTSVNIRESKESAKLKWSQ